MRAGAHALSLLSVPLNAELLTALRSEPRSLVDVRRAIGFPPETTMRSNIRQLVELGVIERRRLNSFPGPVAFELTDAGQELVDLATLLDLWLSECPEGPQELATAASKSTVRALIEGWNTRIIRALAARPLTLTELNSVIKRVSYPSLERRLVAMRYSGQLSRTSASGRGSPYVVTNWLRRAVAPIATAVRWERSHIRSHSASVQARDVEAVLLLALPLLELPEEIEGVCRLAVDLRYDRGETQAGVLARIEAGRVVGCLTQLDGNADAFVTGTVQAWLAAMIDEDPDGLELSGDFELARAIPDALYSSLFRAQGPVAKPIS